ncbi:hypothetical protein [Sporocytophaga myxococcoides]|nr:hypothetical protein [Sporocytophaga myxococcoides]
MPITNLSLSGLKGPEIGQGAAFAGLMRQLGGSFGIAIINTFIVRKSVQHRSDVVSHLSVDGINAMDRVHEMQQGFAAKGFSAEQVLAKGCKLLDLGITKQAMVLSYMDAFLYLGILFLIYVPFVLILLRKNKGANVDLSSTLIFCLFVVC